MRMLARFVAAVAAVILAPAFGFAQQTQPSETMAHGTALEGVVTQVRFASCGTTPESCQGIFEVVPSSEAMAMHGSAMAGDHMMMEHPVTVIVVPGAALMYQGASLPLTRVKPGDQVKLEYQTIDNMNIALSLTMTSMGHM